MACCSEKQTECLRVVTIGYLKNFIGTNIQNGSGNALSINYSDNAYCPTYGELTGGTFIQTWSQGSTPNGDRDGIVVNSTCTGTGSAYINNQLVDQRDLSMKYTRFKSFSVSSPGNDVNQCGASVTLSYSHTYTRYTTSMNTSCANSTSSSDVSDTANGEITWTPGCNWISVNQSTLVATVSRQPTFTTYGTQPRRCCNVTGSITFRGTARTSSTQICQTALGGSWIQDPTTYDRLTATAYTENNGQGTSVGCCGGSYGMNGTGTYTYHYHWRDECGTNYTNITSAVTYTESLTGSPYYVSGSFTSRECCNDTSNCCTGGNDGPTSLTISWHGLSVSSSFTQTCASKDDGCCPGYFMPTGGTSCWGHYGEYITMGGFYYPGYKNSWGECAIDWNTYTISSTTKYCECDNYTDWDYPDCDTYCGASGYMNGYIYPQIPRDGQCYVDWSATPTATTTYFSCDPCPDTGDTGSTGSCTTCTDCSDEKVGSDYDWITSITGSKQNSDGSVDYDFQAYTHHYCTDRSCPYCPGSPSCSHCQGITVGCGQKTIVGDGLVCEGGPCP